MSVARLLCLEFVELAARRLGRGSNDVAARIDGRKQLQDHAFRADQRRRRDDGIAVHFEGNRHQRRICRRGLSQFRSLGSMTILRRRLSNTITAIGAMDIRICCRVIIVLRRSELKKLSNISFSVLGCATSTIFGTIAPFIIPRHAK